MHSKCNVLESLENHPPTPWSGEKSSSMKPVPGAKNVGDLCARVLWGVKIYSISERSWNVREKVEVFWGGWIISEGSGVLQRQLKSLHGVDWDISEVSGSSGGDGVWPWRLPENPSTLICSPGILESLEVQSHALSPTLRAGYRTPVQPHTVISMASKVMLVARALGSNIQCCLQVSGTRRLALMWHPIGTLSFQTTVRLTWPSPSASGQDSPSSQPFLKYGTPG